MKIGIINANGTYGKPLVSEALKRGMDVTVFVRNENETEAKNVVVKEIPDITAEDLAGLDAVIDASGIWTPEYLPRHYDNVLRLCDALAGSNAKFLIVGGTGATFKNEDLEKWFGTGTSHEIKLEDGHAQTTWFGADMGLVEGYARVTGERLAAIMGSGYATMEGLYAALRERKDVNWIFMEPSCEFAIPLTSDTVSVPYDDYAIDMLDEIEHGIHFQQRVGATCN